VNWRLSNTATLLLAAAWSSCSVLLFRHDDYLFLFEFIQFSLEQGDILSRFFDERLKARGDRSGGKLLDEHAIVAIVRISQLVRRICSSKVG
jgi:hypothetical protein